MGNRKIKKIYTACFLCMMFMLFSVNIAAAQVEEASLTIKHLAEDVEITLYKVADFSTSGQYKLTTNFEKYADEVQNLGKLETNPEEMTTENWINLAHTLEAYVANDNIPYDESGKTDENGVLVFENMDTALYLILNEPALIDNEEYIAAPLLITVPNQNEDGAWNYDVILDYSGKLSPNDTYNKYVVIKKWEDEGYEEQRVKEIQVKLFVDQKEYDTVTLNEDNNWRYVWDNLPDGVYYSVFEVDVPEEYQVESYSDGGSLVLVNTYRPNEPGDPEPPGNVPQTGQLWWPVPFLAMAGMILFAIGWTRRMNGGR